MILTQHGEEMEAVMEGGRGREGGREEGGEGKGGRKEGRGKEGKGREGERRGGVREEGMKFHCICNNLPLVVYFNDQRDISKIYLLSSDSDMTTPREELGVRNVDTNLLYYFSAVL